VIWNWAWAGPIGTTIVVIAYLPQIFALVRGKEASAISVPSYALNAFAMGLLLVYAILRDNTVFIVLTAYQFAALCLIVLLTLRFRRREASMNDETEAGF
jgi:uncharacterized protein with PQ loop repeat